MHQTLNILTWQQLNDDTGGDNNKDINEAWVSLVSTTTGLLTGTAGVISADLSDYTLAQGGPKWVNGSDGTWIAYSRRPGADIDDGPPGPRRTVGFRKYNSSLCQGTNPATCFEPQDQIPQPQNETSCEIRAVVYTSEAEGLQYPGTVVYSYRELGGSCSSTPENSLHWASLDDWDGQTGSELVFNDATANWGRISEITEGNYDGLYILTTTKDANDVDQVTLISVTNPNDVRVITGDGTEESDAYDPGWNQNKFTPIAWHDPETGDDMIVMRQSFPNVSDASEIAIWRKTGILPWRHYLTLTPEDIGEEDLDVLLSPEPFVFNGESYLVLSSADNLTIDQKTDGNIWVVRLAPGFPKGSVDWSRRVNTRVSPQVVRKRVEGEVFFLTGTPDDRPVIYYSMLEDVIADNGLNCSYLDTAALENSTLRKAEVCPPGVDDGPC